MANNTPSPEPRAQSSEPQAQRPRPRAHRWILAAIVLVLVLGAVGAWLAFSSQSGGGAAGEMMDRQTFRCYAVSESARTVAAARLDRKEGQIERIRRLLDTGKLDPLDESKLRAELAILQWDVADSELLRNCAEAYYKPGSTHLRQTFEAAPRAPSLAEPRKSFEQTLEAVSTRTLPHGFEERAHLHMAEASLARGDVEEARAIAEARLAEAPEGLYSDTYQVVLADALTAKGDLDEAARIYEEVGKLKIGLDAHYARYRLSGIKRAAGQTDEAEKLMADVVRWSERGDREALEKVLKAEVPVPPPVE